MERAGGSLADAVASLSPDAVLVDMARPAALFVDEDAPVFMEAAIGAGVPSCNALGMPPPDVKPTVRYVFVIMCQRDPAPPGGGKLICQAPLLNAAATS